METEIIICKEDKNFDSYKISRLIDSDFGKKPQKSCALIPISLTSPQLVAIPSALVSFTSLSPTPSPSAQVLANTSIYPMQLLGTGPTSEAYMQPPSTRSPPQAHMLPSTRPSLRAYLAKIYIHDVKIVTTMIALHLSWQFFMTSVPGLMFYLK